MNNKRIIDGLRMIITPRWYNPAFYAILILSAFASGIAGFFMDFSMLFMNGWISIKGITIQYMIGGHVYGQ